MNMKKTIILVASIGLLFVGCGKKTNSPSEEIPLPDSIPTAEAKDTTAMPAGLPQEEVSLQKCWVSDYPKTVTGDRHMVEVVIDLSQEGKIFYAYRLTEATAKATGASTTTYYIDTPEGQAVVFKPTDENSGEILFPPYESAGGWKYSRLTANSVTISYEEGQIYDFKLMDRPIKMEPTPDEVNDYIMEH